MRVHLFTTCLGDLFAPKAVLATGRILRRLGHDLELPEQTCCGQPAYNSGYAETARSFVQSYFDRFRSAEAVVMPSGSCAAMLQQGLRRFLPRSGEAKRLAERTYELTQFLLAVPGPDRLGGSFAARVAYHASCHLAHWLPEGDGGRRLLEKIAGLELVPFPEPQLCCGFGGTFAVRFPELSLAMADEKLRQIEERPPDFLVAADTGCLLQLGGRLKARGSRTKPLHIAVLLDRAGVGG